MIAKEKKYMMLKIVEVENIKEIEIMKKLSH